jgi:hypothetical protein
MNSDRKDCYLPISQFLSRSSTDPGADDDQERAGFLSDKLRLADSYRQPRNFKFIVATGLNVLLFIFSCILCGTWYYNTHWKLNAALVRANTFST